MENDEARDSVETRGRTVDEAIRAALDELGVSRDDVDVEILAEGRSRVIVDVEHYRDRREQSLRGIALRAADRVRRERRALTLQPMPPNERRIIHLTLQSSPWVTTESTGEGAERRVVISPKAVAPPSPRRPSYGYPRGIRG